MVTDMKPVVRETIQVFIHAQFISVLSKVHLLPKNIFVLCTVSHDLGVLFLYSNT